MFFRKKRGKLVAIVAGAGLLAVSAPLAMQAGANTLTSGSVTLSTIGAVTTGAPYSSGQTIDISVAANSTLSLSNLETNGGYSGEPAMKAVECADPEGLSANLPSTPVGHCDGQTLLSTSAVNADGSFTINNYGIFALPDSATFGENPNSAPVCGVGNDECVLYLGPNQNDFSKPHLFSAPFSVLANGDDGGENPGDGSAQTAQAITFTSTPPSPAVVGGTYTPTATGGGSGNPVVFSIGASSTSGACSVSGTAVDFTGIGTCVIDANQAGTNVYSAAPQMSQSATVEATQVITFTSTPPSPAVVGGTYTPTATGGASGNPVVFSIGGASTSGACSVSGTAVDLTGTGTCVVDANQAGNSQYEAAAAGEPELQHHPGRTRVHERRPRLGDRRHALYLQRDHAGDSGAEDQGAGQAAQGRQVQQVHGPTGRNADVDQAQVSRRHLPGHLHGDVRKGQGQGGRDPGLHPDRGVVVPGDVVLGVTSVAGCSVHRWPWDGHGRQKALQPNAHLPVCVGLFSALSRDTEQAHGFRPVCEQSDVPPGSGRVGSISRGVLRCCSGGQGGSWSR